MKILGIATGAHSSGLSIIEDGKIILSLEEERHSRVKPYVDFWNSWIRFPYMCWFECFGRLGFKFSDIDYVASHQSYEEIKWIISTFGVDYSNPDNFIKVDHHDCHIWGSYFTSGFLEESLCLAIDGAGFGYSSKYYLGKDGNLAYISGLAGNGSEPGSMASLGLYYSIVTDFLEFKRIKDEGKVVGMSSHGNFNQTWYDMFFSLISGEGYHNQILSGSDMVKKLHNNFYDVIGDGYWKGHKKDLAYNAQLAFENRIIQIVESLHQEYPNAKKLVLSGGCFANIKTNKRINDLEWVDEVYIVPPMGDEGVPIGAGLYAYKQLVPNFLPQKLDNAFMGSSYNMEEILNDWDDTKFSCIKYSPSKVASLLSEGKIIGFFSGAYEHGPRALGARSILAHPGLETTYKKVNDRLQRNDYMPFAPSILEEYANDVFLCQKSSYTGQFMTMLYDTREEWIDRIPAVVHPIDKTARAQIVKRDTNPKFHQIIEEFYKITNIPLLLNTSFNTHGEPIVSRPLEAFAHLETGIVDGLVVENLYFEKRILE
jgi:carbamoyltransferase